MSDIELKQLKEQIKQELLQEMKQPKQETVWQKIKQEYENQFKKFNYTRHWEAYNLDNKLITTDKEINADNILQNAISAILRVKYKVDNVSKINASYEEIKSIVDNILKALNQNMEVLEG